ncbi:MAG: DUF3857 domain-containing protein [Pseudomonadota bacterium]|jgi:transglutaminase-like putative cysteine protease
MSVLRLCGFVLPLAATLPLHAAPVTSLKSEVTYELLPDGSSVVERIQVTRLNEQVAVTGAGQAGIQYSDGLHQVEIIEAYTTTKDGQRVDVPADRIFTQQLPVSAGAPAFSDQRVRMVVFPQLEIGATVTLHYRSTQSKAWLPGVYTGGEVFSRFGDSESGRTVVLRAPAGVTLHTFGRDVEGGEVDSGKPGTREWRWRQGPVTAETPEPGMVDAASISPGVMFSTLPDYPALMDAWMQNATPMMQVTPKVQALADEITRGITDRRGQAEALYRWVAGEIRYVAIALGNGGYVPHPADEVIEARYGDCKDKTVLLVALLAARGIRAVPVLIRTGDRYTWQEVPLLAAFNHAIAYLPEFDLYVDGTVPLAPFDSLPAPLRGRQVLVAGDAQMKSSIRQIPPIDARRDREVTRTTAEVAADGTLSGTSRVHSHGATDGPLRSSLSMLPEQMLGQVARQMLAASGQTGQATLTLGNLRDFGESNLLSVKFETPGVIHLPGPGAISGNIGIGTSPGKAFATAMLQLERRFDFPCPAGGSTQVIELALAPGMKITTLPPAADVKSPYGHFTASYEVKDGRLLMAQTIELTPPATVCTAADHAELRKFATAIDRELRRQVLYE